MFAKQQMMMNRMQRQVNAERAAAREQYMTALAGMDFDLGKVVTQLNGVISREESAQTGCFSIFHTNRFNTASARGLVADLKEACKKSHHTEALSKLQALDTLMGQTVLGTKRCSASSSTRVDVSVHDMLSGKFRAYVNQHEDAIKVASVKRAA